MWAAQQGLGHLCGVSEPRHKSRVFVLLLCSCAALYLCQERHRAIRCVCVDFHLDYALFFRFKESLIILHVVLS